MTLIDIDIGNVYRPVEERPLSDRRKPLWADGDTMNAFPTTMEAYDIFSDVYHPDGAVVRVKEDL